MVKKVTYLLICVSFAFRALRAFGACEIFLQKKNKEFKTALITSFILLLRVKRLRKTATLGIFDFFFFSLHKR